MKILDLSNINILYKYNRLNLNKIKEADVFKPELPDGPQPIPPGYLGQTYSNKTKEENMSNLLSILRNLDIKEAEWETLEMNGSKGETSELQYQKPIEMQSCKWLDKKA